MLFQNGENNIAAQHSLSPLSPEKPATGQYPGTVQSVTDLEGINFNIIFPPMPQSSGHLSTHLATWQHRLNFLTVIMYDVATSRIILRKYSNT